MNSETKYNEVRYNEAKEVLKEWLDKKGHDRCWYYPELFHKLVQIFGLASVKNPELPSEAEFEEFCTRFRREQYSKLEAKSQ